MSFNKKFFTTGGIVAASGVCNTDSHDIFTGGVALYNLDYDASDASGSYDGTPTDVTFGVGGQINYGARFNGSSSRIRTSLDFDTLTNYTISMWIKVDSSPTSNTLFAGTIDSSAKNGIYLSVESSDTVRFFERNTSTTVTSLTSTDTINIGDWNHIVAIRNGSTNFLYINNGTAVSASNGSFNHAIDFTIGRSGDYSTSHFDGDIDQVRIFSSALTSTQVSTLYAEEACVHTATANTADFPSGATAVAHYPLDNSAEDNHGNTYDGTESGDVEYRFGKYGQAAVLSGTSSYIDTGIGGSVLGELFSVSCWFKSSATGTYQTIFDNGGNTSGESGFTLVIHTDNTLKARFSNGDNNALSDLTTSTTVTDGNWHHCVLTYNNESAKIYLDNGTPSTGTNTKAFTQASNNLRIGAFVVNGTLLEFNGMLDQVRVYSTELTSDQVSQLYNEKPETDTSNFKTVLYEGDGGSQYISNVGIDLETNGGLVWLKNRSEAYNHQVYDSVRGAGNSSFSKSLVTNNNQAESWSSSTNGYLSSFDANGFSLTQGGTNADAVNRNNNDYVAWVWKGGGDASNIAVNSITGSTPSIASDVSANVDAGFSIVKYTGNDSATMTVAHGLDERPEIVITKKLDGTQTWAVYTNVVTQNGTTNWLRLDDTQAFGSGNFMDLSDTLLSANQIGGYWMQGSHIAYCWHSVSGYSKIGSYTGGGTSDVVVTTGFKPQFIMTKRTDNTGNWIIFDSKRSTSDTDFDNFIYPNLSDAEVPNVDAITVSDTGFTVTRDNAAPNFSGANYIYMAFK